MPWVDIISGSLTNIVIPVGENICLLINSS